MDDLDEALRDAILLLGDPGDPQFMESVEAFGRLIGYLFPDAEWDSKTHVRRLLEDLGIVMH